MRLNQFVREVGTWHVGCFDSKGELPAMRRKLAEECAEAVAAIEPWEIAEECADVLIVLCAIAYREDFDLEAWAADKLKKVRDRDQLARDVAKGVVNA